MPAPSSPSRRQSATSASLPTSSEPSSSSRPRQRAPSIVARASAWRAVSACGPPASRANCSAARISDASPPSSFEAAPSTPRPTGTPAPTRPATGAIPAPSRALEFGQWATPVPVAPKRRDLGVVEVHAVRQPHVVAEPAELVEVVDGAHAEALLTEALLVERLGQMRMQAHAATARQLGGIGHQPARHRERRARRERDPHHRTRRWVVETADRGLAGGQDRIAVLDDLVGRKAAIRAPEIHRAAAGVKPQADRRGGADLDLEEVARRRAGTRSGGRSTPSNPTARAPPARRGPRPSRSRRRSAPTPGRARPATRTASPAERGRGWPTGRGGDGS